MVLADAETDADLDALAHAALASEPVPLLVGSAGLAGALARRLGLYGSPVALAASAPLADRRRQPAPGHPTPGRGGPRRRTCSSSPRETPTAVTARWRPGTSRPRPGRLLDEDAADLVVVTGGETAVALFEALGASRIDLVGAPRPGLALGYLSAARPPGAPGGDQGGRLRRRRSSYRLPKFTLGRPGTHRRIEERPGSAGARRA